MTPDELEHETTLTSAATRLEELRTRAALEEELSRQEALELLALAEVVARKAAYGRQLDVRTARRAGASWAEIGSASGTSKQAAWQAHDRWIASQHGLTPDELARERALAANPAD